VNATQHDALQHSLRSPGAGARSSDWIWGAGVVAFALTIPSGLIAPGIARIVTDLGWTLSSAIAAIGAFQAARVLSGTERRAWLLFGCGTAAWCAGQLVWDFYELILGVSIPFPSLADVGYVTFVPFMLAGVLTLRSTQTVRSVTPLRLANVGVIVSSLAVIVMVMVTRPFTLGRVGSWATLLVVAENLTNTVACVVAMYILWSYHWGTRLAAMALLTVAMVTHMIAGVFYARALIAADYGVSSAFNMLWLIAFGFQYYAARWRVAATRDVSAENVHAWHLRQGWVEAVLPAALLLCVAVTGFALVDEFTPTMIAVSSGMLFVFASMLAVREGLLYREGQQTRTNLELAQQQLAGAAAQLAAMETDRREREQEIELTARAGAVGLWDWDMGHVVRFSREWKQQLGYAEHEIADDVEEWRSRLHPDDYERMTRSVADFAAHPTGEFTYEQRLRHRDGTYRWILSRGTVVRYENGQARRMLGSHVDITERKLAELSLRESEARNRSLVNQLEQRVASRTTELTDAYRESRNFAYAVAHDLKSPLRAIDGFSALLVDSASARLTPDELEHLGRIRRGAINMGKLIDGLLEYSRLEHRDLNLHAVECQEIAADLVQSMDAVIHAAGARVECALTPSRVLADVEGLRIIFRNLLDNALKFRSPNRVPHIQIGSRIEAECVILWIRDNGIGFAPEYAERIFDIFNRLHASGYEGTGIGLALVRKAVHRMHGRIWAESAVDRGATFYVSLPIATAGAE
jgi:PAS domain S-box-containing protein